MSAQARLGRQIGIEIKLEVCVLHRTVVHVVFPPGQCDLNNLGTLPVHFFDRPPHDHCDLSLLWLGAEQVSQQTNPRTAQSGDLKVVRVTLGNIADAGCGLWIGGIVAPPRRPEARDSFFSDSRRGRCD